jgi:Domain of unknown function (DUF4437)
MWNRPRIEFIDTSTLAWAPLVVDGLPEGIESRLLSEDVGDGASTRLLRLPTSWHSKQPFLAAAPLHLFIVRGRLELDGQLMRAGGYTYIPCGLPLPPIEVHEDTLAVCYWDGPLERVRGSVSPDPDDAPVPPLDSRSMHWEMGPTVGPAAGLGWKMLRHVPHSGESMFVTGILPDWTEPRHEAHPCAEESFKLAGDMDMGPDIGVMREGCYFYRPPYLWHGPMRTERGTMSLIRISSGMANAYKDPREPLPLDARGLFAAGGGG